MKNCNALLNHLLGILGLPNDAALSRALECAPPVISKLRGGTLPLGATMIIRMHQVSGMTIAAIKEMGGVVTKEAVVQNRAAATGRRAARYQPGVAAS